MSRKLAEIKINTVEFYYIGKDKDFELFLKSVVHDYLCDTKEQPEIVGNVEKSA